ncbi:MAG TPA: SpoIIE family protein phosphatase [Bryobacteraceae bacterium]|nr:SpoIIE family protein phosphatase [Bryobacteraceae bacterium]
MSVRGTGPRKGYWPYVLLSLFCALALSYHVRSTFAILDSPVQVRDPFAGLIAVTMRVARPLPEAASAGLRVNDKVLSVNGMPFRGVGDYYEALQHAKPGDLLQLQVQAGNSAPRDVAIKLRPRFTRPGTAPDRSLAIFLVLVSWFSIALGIWITAVRVRDIRAWMILLVLAGLALQFDNVRPYYGYADFLRPITVGWQNFIGNTWSIPLLLFGVYFPDRLALDRRFPWLKWLIILPLLLLLSRNAIFLMIGVGHAEAAQAFRRLFSFNYAKEPFDIAAFIILFACLIYRTVTATGRDQRRRLLFLDAGAAIALLPYFSYYCLALIFHVLPPRWFQITTLSLLFAFPLTMAYVIVVHRAMDFGVVVRTGVRYLLASNGVRALQIVLSVLIIAVAATMSFGSATSLSRIAIIAVAIVAMLLLGRFAERARLWVDRRFFREAYDGESILNDLSGKVRSVVEIGPLLEMVATRIAESLHIDRIAVMLAGDGGFRPAYALGYSDMPDIQIPGDGRTAQRLRSEQSVTVDTAAEKENPDPDSIALERLQPELLLPLSLNEKVLGILSLGPKRSEAPFTRGDVRLLSSVATQTALALENSRLVAEVKAEVAQRERMNRELEIAREVQERLFPQTIPSVPGVDLSGFCRPALGVGGDYYDYFSLVNGELCIAVGDVSGKGIPASLLMASLRASLRARTMSVESDLAALMSNINKLVYESSAVNKYATFFYGQYSPESRVLRYVNAGHEPPLVFRNGELIPLDTGGPVVGLLPMARFEQGCVQLQSGDLLLAFTDGISEAMNPEDEEWGVEKLVCCVHGCGDIPAQDLIKKIMCAADAFAAGAKQHDDMTIVAARVL